MTDDELLDHCLNALTNEYGEIAKMLLVEALQKRLGRPLTVTQPDTVSPAELRWRANRPWDDKESY
jgi:hypothetical protein